MTDLPPDQSSGSVAGRSTSDQLKDTAAHAKDEFARSTDQVREQVASGIEGARDEAVARTESAKDDLASELSKTADALHSAAGDIEEGSIQHQILNEAAGGLSRISGALQGRNISEIVSDLSDFGRRNPAAFLGGAALTGFALARFARASDRGGSQRSDPARSDFRSASTPPKGTASGPMANAGASGSGAGSAGPSYAPGPGAGSSGSGVYPTGSRPEEERVPGADSSFSPTKI